MKPAPQISLYRGFRPGSPTLWGPLWSRGAQFEKHASEGTSRKLDIAEPSCLGDKGGYMAFYDPAAPLYSGDQVIVLTKRKDGSESFLCKRIVKVAGQPYLTCEWATFPLASVQYAGIAARVAEVFFPDWGFDTPPMYGDRKEEESTRLQVNAANHHAIGWLLANVGKW